MPYGIATYSNGIEVLNTASPYNLFHSVRVDNLTSGTHQITLSNSSAIVGTVIITTESTTVPDQIVSLGGTGSNYSINSYSIVGKVLTLNVGTIEGEGLSSVAYSFYITRS